MGGAVPGDLSRVRRHDDHRRANRVGFGRVSGVRRAMSRLAVISVGVAGFALVPVLAGGLTPEDAVKRMRVPDGFEVRLVASEPLIRQPVSMSFDDRGRLWV